MGLIIDEPQIQEKLQEIHALTNKTEQQIYIVLDRDSGRIMAVLGAEGTDGETIIDGYTRGASKILIKTDKEYALLGQAHTHNLMKQTTNNNSRSSTSIGGEKTENGFGTSEKVDKPTAKSLGINIYALDSWNFSSKKAEVSIGRVTPSGIQTSNIGKTYGKGDGNKTVNIGLECLNLRVGR